MTILLLVALHVLSPEFSPCWRVVSECAFGHYGWMLSLMFLSWGIGSWDWRYRSGNIHNRSPAHALPAVHKGYASRDLPHQLALLPFAALLINLSLARNNDARRSVRRVLLWIAGLPLFGFLSFAVYSAIFVFPMGPGAYGPGVNIGWPPRFAFLTYMLRFVTLGWQAVKSRRQLLN